MSSDKSKEDLVAYLDGELPEESASQVEKTLVEDPSVRRDVEELSRSFDLLDLLPTSQAPDGFSEKTITIARSLSELPNTESADETASTPETSAGRPSDFPRRAAVWGVRFVAFLGLMVVATAGFNGSFRQNSEQIDELLTELPVIQRLDEYQEIGDMEFLEALNESGLFDERDKTPQD